MRRTCIDTRTTAYTHINGQRAKRTTYVHRILSVCTLYTVLASPSIHARIANANMLDLSVCYIIVPTVGPTASIRIFAFDNLIQQFTENKNAKIFASARIHARARAANSETNIYAKNVYLRLRDNCVFKMLKVAHLPVCVSRE